ncbi:unnamed protein product, partial [Nesidiocoris tenuis]
YAGIVIGTCNCNIAYSSKKHSRRSSSSVFEEKLRAGIHLEPYPILGRILVKRTDSTGIFLFISRIARNTGSIVIDIDTVLPNSRSLTILAIRTLLRRTTNFKAISSKSDQSKKFIEFLITKILGKDEDCQRSLILKLGAILIREN